jgi:SAM-dependent methyltransferase
MILQRLKWRAASAISFTTLRLDSSRERFTCPICDYRGIFLDVERETGNRQHALCPKCRLLERHRLQWLAVQRLREELDFATLRVLHIAPEKFISKQLRSLCTSYISADLYEKGVDRREDLTQMSFPDGTFDLVYCSHVLEHIKDDLAAIREVRRVLAPGGIAVLPVPILSDVTVEYQAPNPHESDHVRAPGIDYFDRYKMFFEDVQVFSSAEFDARYQLYTYEDRSCWPTPTLPHRRPSLGLKHSDYVPICRVA